MKKKKYNIENTILDKDTLKEKYGDAKVGVVQKTDELMEALKGDPFIAYENRFVWEERDGKPFGVPIATYVNQRIETAPRRDAEVSRTLLQPIAYCMLVSGDRVFATRRVEGDDRLKGLWSIGIGGHIDAGEDVASSLERELTEEMVLDYDKDILAVRRIGYIYDDSTLVNSVHLGIIHKALIYITSADKVKIKETDKLEGEWIEKSDLLDETLPFEGFESWSRIIIEQARLGNIKL